MRRRRVSALVIVLLSTAGAAEEPPLPAGLGEPEQPKTPAGASSLAGEPALPAGLQAPSPEPALPPGLGTAESKDSPPPAGMRGLDERLGIEMAGFWEARGGFRLHRDRYQRTASIGESRLQLQMEKAWETAALRMTTDFLYDPVLGEHDIHLEEGDGWVDLRELYVLLRPVEFMDVKIGRQTLTWGTGDLIFINDLFPKDWDSFFIGRDVEYLKAPSDAAKVSLFSDVANLDVVYTPRFDADRFIDGRRISFYNAPLGRRSGRDTPVRAKRPDDWIEDDEVALRLYRNLGAYEAAIYAYDGFWKSPGGMDPGSGRPVFPALRVYGASLRGPTGPGIGHVEFGYYDSHEDPDGDDPLIRNSEFRFLAGYEQEITRNFTAGVQYYLELMMDYGAYRRSLPAGFPEADENRHVVTLRLTRLLMDQTLEVSLFTFYSPSDKDAYLRPRVRYKIDDHWSAEIGGNLFLGEQRHTFFGQFEDNSNVYAAVRYGF